MYKHAFQRRYCLGIDQLLTWGVLLVVLTLIASGRIPMELSALGGLFILGIAGAAPPSVIFSGFGHPALATIIAVFLVSQGIIDSQLLRGLGQALARRFRSIRAQVLSIAAVGALLSAFMNNVGAVSLMLPTAVRMSGRSGSSAGSFGLPLAMASILGGTLTLIGSAPNIIIASHMLSVSGQSFKMFDFAPHGLAMLGTALLLWLFCKACGLDPGARRTGLDGIASSQGTSSDEREVPPLNEKVPFAPLANRQRRMTFFIILLAVLTVSFGLLHPALGFGGAALLLVVSGVLKPLSAYQSVDLKIVFFLGAMLGIGQTLEYTGALDSLSAYLAYFGEGLSPFWLIMLLVFVSSALSNAINNSAAAVFMAPLAVGISGGNGLDTAAALMAVAAGSNMALLLPTHQATLMVMSKAPFSPGSFTRAGLALSLCCGLAAAAVIALVWK